MDTISLTKFEQDCFSIKIGDGRYFIFDPGSESTVNQFLGENKPEAIFISHAHPDHFSIEKIKLLDCPVYGPLEIYNALQTEVKILKKIDPGDHLVFGSLSIDVFLVDHGIISAPLVNLGFHIKIEGKSILFLGDIALPSPIPIDKYDIILIPVGGSKVFDPEKAYDFIKSINYKGIVIPMHFHGRADRTSGMKFHNIASSYCEVKVLDVSESISL